MTLETNTRTESIICKSYGEHGWSSWIVIERKTLKDTRRLGAGRYIYETRNCINCGLGQVRKWNNN